MSLKANALKSNESQKKAIAKEVNSILAHMDDELKICHEQGRHAIIISVPITFSIPYMSNTNAQRTIYYKILNSLLERGFNVKIELKKDASLFHVTWLSDEELTDLKLQTEVLARHTKKDLSKTVID